MSENQNTELMKIEKEKALQAVSNLGLSEIKDIVSIFIQSQYFTKITVSQAITKVMLGQEIGISPIQSIQHVHVFSTSNGTAIQVGSHIIAGKIKENPKYDYELIESNPKKCVLDFFEYRNNERIKVGYYEFTIKDAQDQKLTGKPNWSTDRKKQDMLFNRCISGGYKKYCPDIFNIPVYTDADEIPDKVLPANPAPDEKVDFTVETAEKIDETTREPNSQSVSDESETPVAEKEDVSKMEATEEPKPKKPEERPFKTRAKLKAHLKKLTKPYLNKDPLTNGATKMEKSEFYETINYFFNNNSERRDMFLESMFDVKVYENDLLSAHIYAFEEWSGIKYKMLADEPKPDNYAITESESLFIKEGELL